MSVVQHGGDSGEDSVRERNAGALRLVVQDGVTVFELLASLKAKCSTSSNNNDSDACAQQATNDTRCSVMTVHHSHDSEQRKILYMIHTYIIYVCIYI